jgi:hypothetical protein
LVILGLEAEADIVEVFKRLGNVFAVLAHQDACQLSSEDHIGKRHELLLFQDEWG